MVLHLVLLAVLAIAAFTAAHPANLSPFLLGGLDNMFAAAAFVFFSFVGACTAACTSS